MDNYYLVIGLALVGFVVLATALLVPIYFFLKKEEKTAEHWTAEYLNLSGGPDEAKNVEPPGSEKNISEGHPVDGSPLG